MAVREKLVEEAKKRGFKKIEGRDVCLEKGKILLFETYEQSQKSDRYICMRVNYDYPLGDAEMGFVLLFEDMVDIWLDFVVEEAEVRSDDS